MQIFFREFKTQLHKYLNIHREIWEEISEIKEKKFIKGKEVELHRSTLESYRKTISLIKNRINQMNAYAKTRQSIAKKIKVEDHLISLFEFRFEDLFGTLDYIKEIWNMTLDYVDSAIKIMVEVSGKATGRGIKSIQLLASIGVITGLMRYAGQTSFPKISQAGALYLIILGAAAFGFDFILSRRAKTKQYKLKFVERDKKI
jgi:hypothetical protein